MFPVILWCRRLLKKNRIESIDNGTFSNLQKLKVL